MTFSAFAEIVPGLRKYLPGFSLLFRHEAPEHEQSLQRASQLDLDTIGSKVIGFHMYV